MIDTKERAGLRNTIQDQIHNYLTSMKGEQITDLYEMLMEQVEPPLYQAVMESSKYNQVRAANILGISRGTLRAKLRKYFGDKYVGTRS